MSMGGLLAEPEGHRLEHQRCITIIYVRETTTVYVYVAI